MCLLQLPHCIKERLLKASNHSLALALPERSVAHVSVIDTEILTKTYSRPEVLDQNQCKHRQLSNQQLD